MRTPNQEAAALDPKAVKFHICIPALAMSLLELASELGVCSCLITASSTFVDGLFSLQARVIFLFCFDLVLFGKIFVCRGVVLFCFGFFETDQSVGKGVFQRSLL